LLNTAKIQKTNNSYQGYAQNPISASTPVIEGYFYKESTLKDMTIRKINKSLCWLLAFAIMATFVSYYFVMRNELTLNTLSRSLITINDENFELQNSIDKMKSFNNVDNKMMQQNFLHKAGDVIEVAAVQTTPVIDNIKNNPSTPFKWSIGY